MSAREGEQLVVPSIAFVKSIVDHLAELELSPLHLHVDGRDDLDKRPDMKLWMRTRTDFETFCTAFQLKATEKRYTMAGQREWYAEHDTEGHRLLVQVVSLTHHADWIAREVQR